MKKKVIGIAAVIVLLAAGVFTYLVVRARTAAADAVQTYNSAVQEYNAAISPFNQAASGIAEANDQLQKALDAAQAVLDKGQAAYEPDTQDQLKSAVQKAKKSLVQVPVQIDPLEERQVPGSFNTKDLELAQHEAETALKAVEEAKAKIPGTPSVPDYARELNSVQTAQKSYEDSVQMLANVTAPQDSFVMERIEKIKTVIETEAVTAEKDPNGLLGKKEGYKGCVYFLDERVDRELLPQEAFVKEKEKDGQEGNTATESVSDHSGEAGTGSAESAAGEETAAPETSAGTDESAAPEASAGINESAAPEASAGTNESAAPGTYAVTDQTAAAAETAAVAEPGNQKDKTIDVVMIGTAGGGAVEIFATREEAEKRAEYISFFDGSVMDAGACRVEGTCVIRASRHLQEQEQQKLIGEVRQALLAVE